jgi:hypothetical protein
MDTLYSYCFVGRNTLPWLFQNFHDRDLLHYPLDLLIVVCNKIVIHVGHICYYPPDIFGSPNFCEDQNIFMGQWKCFKEIYIIQFQNHSKSVLKTLYLFQQHFLFNILIFFIPMYISILVCYCDHFIFINHLQG